MKRIIILCSLFALAGPALAEKDARDLSRDELRPYKKKIAAARRAVNEAARKLWAPGLSWQERVDRERDLRGRCVELEAAVAEVPKSAEHGYHGEWGAVNGAPGGE